MSDDSTVFVKETLQYKTLMVELKNNLSYIKNLNSFLFHPEIFLTKRHKPNIWFFKSFSQYIGEKKFRYCTVSDRSNIAVKILYYWYYVAILCPEETYKSSSISPLTSYKPLIP